MARYVRAYQWAVSGGLEAVAALQHTEFFHSGDSGGALKHYITLPFTQGQIYHTDTDNSTQGHPPPSSPTLSTQSFFFHPPPPFLLLLFLIS